MYSSEHRALRNLHNLKAFVRHKLVHEEKDYQLVVSCCIKVSKFETLLQRLVKNLLSAFCANHKVSVSSCFSVFAARVAEVEGVSRIHLIKY